MEIYRKICSLYLIVFVAAQPEHQAFSDNTFSKHYIIHPRIHHGKQNRSIKSTFDTEYDLHMPHLQLSYQYQGKNIYVNLHLNEHLLPAEHFLRYQHKDIPDDYIVQNYTKHDVELCHYQGTIRGLKNSRVAVSTCNGGVNGLVYDGFETYVIQSSSENGRLEDKHFLYRQSDLNNQNTKINHNDNTMLMPNKLNDYEFPKLSRFQRSLKGTDIRGTYNAKDSSSIVELLLVVDKQLYLHFGKNLKRIHNNCKDLANIMNMLVMPLNIYIVLVGVVVWSESDEINISRNGTETLLNFSIYRGEKLTVNHPNDVAQLLTKQSFDNKVLGKAFVNTICSNERSAGIIQYNHKINAFVAAIMVHELGHNFGIRHDANHCKCPDNDCIMSGVTTPNGPLIVHWSNCSIHYVKTSFLRSNHYCLHNEPTKLFGASQCGNGFVEAQEQCDCGPANQCTNSCCDALTCRLHANATCATGVCCDLATCRPKSAGSECRATAGTCDLPEYCNGETEFCPQDVFKSALEPCGNDENSYCFQGSCRSHTRQCRLLWGATGDSVEQCYSNNAMGTFYGNCGYNHSTAKYIPCETEHVACGRLQCNQHTDRLEFGIGTMGKVYMGKNLVCNIAKIDVGLQHIDPGLTPDGVKCGDGRICFAQKCRAVAQLHAEGLLRQCPENCSGNGVCNSMGNCHCDIGFSGASCSEVGAGGSVDSGPRTNSNINDALLRFVYIFICAAFASTGVYTLLFYFCYSKITDFTSNGTKYSETIKYLCNTKIKKPVDALKCKIDVTHIRLDSTTNENILALL